MPPSLQAIPEVDSNVSSGTDERFKKTKGGKEEGAVEDGNSDSASKKFASSSISRQPLRSTPEQDTAALFLQFQSHYKHQNEGAIFDPNQFGDIFFTTVNKTQERILESWKQRQLEKKLVRTVLVSSLNSQQMNVQIFVY
ncbi:hypothetical protein FRX31_019410 [Thalictrum thalictroides]|uniref:Uncharacterized protein n=1 Tax=Thalictrum thalictroides TaxID=46969 RepID=A0A7J6W1E9_THATH|nr:hypothetical protein FRX31_019410 [Thalictrum thalictroides]